MKSRAIVNISIIVTSITILAILLSWIAPLLFKISLNSPIYYGIVIVLSIFSIIFGILQWIPGLLELRQSRSEWQIHPTSTESEYEQLAFYYSLTSTLTELPARQRKAMLNALLQRKNIDIRSEQQNYPVKVTMKFKGTPVLIEMPDVEKVEDVIKQVAQGMQASTPNTSELDRTLRIRRQASGELPSDQVVMDIGQQSIVRENEGTYLVDDTSTQT